MDEITTTFDGACMALAAKADCIAVQAKTQVRKAMEGADMVEYVILAALIVIVCIAAINTLGGQLNATWKKISDTLAATTTTGGGTPA